MGACNCSSSSQKIDNVTKAIVGNNLAVATKANDTAKTALKIAYVSLAIALVGWLTVFTLIAGYLVENMQIVLEEEEEITITQDTEGEGSNHMNDVNLGVINYGKTDSDQKDDQKNTGIVQK